MGGDAGKISPHRPPAQAALRFTLFSDANKSGSGSAASGGPRRWPEPIVRFARPNILFYDEHVIDLYCRICTLVSNG